MGKNVQFLSSFGAPKDAHSVFRNNTLNCNDSKVFYSDNSDLISPTRYREPVTQVNE